MSDLAQWIAVTVIGFIVVSANLFFIIQVVRLGIEVEKMQTKRHGRIEEILLESRSRRGYRSVPPPIDPPRNH